MKKLKVCKVDEIPLMGGRTVKSGDVEIALFRLSNDRVVAVENRCPHKEGPLVEGIVSGTVIICPLHGWKLDLVTGEAVAPEEGCTKVFEVMVEDDSVFLSLDGDKIKK